MGGGSFFMLSVKCPIGAVGCQSVYLLSDLMKTLCEYIFESKHIFHMYNCKRLT